MIASKQMKRCVLCILDGWGVRDDPEDNAIAQATTPTWDHMWSKQPRTTLEAHSESIGLPPAQIGNSEVGHLTIGAGRRLQLEYPRISEALNNSIGDLPALDELLARAQTSRLHLLFLLSDGGVHGDWKHLIPIITACRTRGITLCLHAIMDGRDTPPQSGLHTLRQWQSTFPDLELHTIMGRYFAMDRDQNWSRTLAAYYAIHDGKGKTFQNPEALLKQHYQQGSDLGNSDEFLAPHCHETYQGMRENDCLLMTNFRADRARQIMFVFMHRERNSASYNATSNQADQEISDVRPLPLVLYSMTYYGSRFDACVRVLFPPLAIEDSLGEVLANHGLSQVRIAETEKYAHVTYFFNGGNETPCKNETRRLLHSPKVATFDLYPQMAAEGICDALLDEMKRPLSEGGASFIVVNFANGDMVGHSGKLDAAILAAQAVDACLTRIERTYQHEWTVLITADHGNFEQMWDHTTNQPHTAHTLNPVPFLILGEGTDTQLRSGGSLIDIAPTILDLFGFSIPDKMTGQSLILRSPPHP